MRKIFNLIGGMLAVAVMVPLPIYAAPTPGGGCPSPWAVAAGYPSGYFPQGYAHSDGRHVCCGGRWVEGASCSLPPLAPQVPWALPIKRDGQWPVLSSVDGDHAVRSPTIRYAWDLNAPQGTPVYPAAPGIVTVSSCGNEHGYGCWVEIDHGGDIRTRYAHLEVPPLVSEGQSVTADTVLGSVGWTGVTSFGPHLHFEVLQAGVRVSPTRLFGQPKELGLEYCQMCNVPPPDALLTTVSEPTLHACESAFLQRAGKGWGVRHGTPNGDGVHICCYGMWVEGTSCPSTPPPAPAPEQPDVAGEQPSDVVGCPSPHAVAAGYPSGYFPHETRHSSGIYICCEGRWVMGTSCSLLLLPAPASEPAVEVVPLPIYAAPTPGGGCPSPWAVAAGYPSGYFPQGYAHSDGRHICCGGQWVEGASCPSTPPPAPAPEQPDVAGEQPPEVGATQVLPDTNQTAQTAGASCGPGCIWSVLCATDSPLGPLVCVEVGTCEPCSSTGVVSSPLSPDWPVEIRQWESEIITAAQTYGFDPNLLAAVMQKECMWSERCPDGPCTGSCTSKAGALGPMQVMPLHFSEGENGRDPKTNIVRGAEVLRRYVDMKGSLRDGLAAYNCGPSRMEDYGCFDYADAVLEFYYQRK